MADYYASIPTYIPPISPGFDYPAYVPATTQLTRSRSNRIVYADDPWNSAGNPELFTPPRRLSRDRAQQPRRLTKRPTQPSITSIFPPEDKPGQEQMNLSRPDLPLSLRPGAGLASYPSTAPPSQYAFSTHAERKLSFQSVSSSESQESTRSPIPAIKGGFDLPKHRSKPVQPTSVPTSSRPRISPPSSPAPAGAGTPASLIPGSRFSSNLGSIDVWADIRSTLDHPATNSHVKRRPLIKLNQAQAIPAVQPPPQRQAVIVQPPPQRQAAIVQPPPQRQAPQRQVAIVQPTERPGPERLNFSPPTAERRVRPNSAPENPSMSRQRTQFHGDWVVVPGARPSSASSLPAEERRSPKASRPPTIPQLQLGAPFPVLVNKRISHIQRDEGVSTRPPRTPVPAPAPSPSRAVPAQKPSIENPFDLPFDKPLDLPTEKPLDLPVEVNVAPLKVTRQPPSRKESTDTTLSQPSRSNTMFFAESAQLTPSPSLTAAIQSVTEEMFVNLSEPSESGSVVHWDVVDTVLKRHGAGRRKSLPQVMGPRSLRLTSDSLDSVEGGIGCECAAVCGHVEQIEHFETESPIEDNDSFDEDEHSDDDSDVEDFLAAWEEEDRSASPTKVVSAVVKRLREEKKEQDQLWDDVRGLLASRGRQGSCDTATTLSSLETDLQSPVSNYSH